MCNSLQLQYATTTTSLPSSNNLICSNTKVTPHFSIGKILPKSTVPMKKEPVMYRPQPLSLGKTVSRNDTTESTTTEKPQPPQQTNQTIQELRQGQNLTSSKLPFLWKLHILLDDVETTGNDHIVSWLEHGRSFKVYRPKSFISMIAPHYFKQSKYKSFQRQLHLYEFCRVQYGPEAGSYSHPLFVRGQPHLCLPLSPIKIKGKARQEERRQTAVIAQQQQQQQQQHHEMEISISSYPSISPGKRVNLANDGSSSFGVATTATTTTTAVLSKREQEEWVAKIQRMVVKGSIPTAEPQPQQYPSEVQVQEQQEELWALLDPIHPMSIPSSNNNHGINNTTVHQVVTDDDDNDDDTCSLFGVNFHLLPSQEDVSSCCEHCCESDTEDEAEWDPLLLDSE